MVDIDCTSLSDPCREQRATGFYMWEPFVFSAFFNLMAWLVVSSEVGDTRFVIFDGNRWTRHCRSCLYDNVNCISPESRTSDLTVHAVLPLPRLDAQAHPSLPFASSLHRDLKTGKKNVWLVWREGREGRLGGVFGKEGSYGYAVLLLFQIQRQVNNSSLKR